MKLYEFVKERVPNGSVLDLGAGDGTFVGMLPDAHGVDMEFESDNVEKDDLLIHLEKRVDKVTTITALDVLEHLECWKVERLFELLPQKCKTFIASLPCPYSMKFWTHPYHKTVWFPEVLGAMAMRGGFDWRIELIPTGSRIEGLRNWLWQKLWLGKFTNDYLFITTKKVKKG